MDNFQYQTEPLDEQEDVFGVFYGNRGQVGSQFVITNRRLMIGPLDTNIARDILEYVGGQLKVPGIDFAKNVLSHYGPMSPKTVWLRHVDEVTPTNGARWLKAPGLRISTATHERIDLAIVHKPRAMNKDKHNEVARDQMIETLRSAVAAAKQAAV